jgi:hypothetical protein
MDSHISHLDIGGSYHLFTNEGSFVVFDGVVMKMYKYPKLTLSKTFKHSAFKSMNEIKPIYLKNSNAILFETYNKIYLFNLNTYKIVKLHPNNSNNSNILNFGISDDSELIWILDTSLLYLYQQNGTSDGSFQLRNKIDLEIIIPPEDEKGKIDAIEYFNDHIQVADSSDSEEAEIEYNCRLSTFDFDRHASVLKETDESLNNIAVTNSGKVIFFRMTCLEEKFICIYDTNSKSTVELPIDMIGEIVFNEKSNIIYVKWLTCYLYIYGNLDEVQCLDHINFVDNYLYGINYRTKILDIKHFDLSGDFIKLDVSMWCENKKITIENLRIVGEIIYICVRDRVLFYTTSGKYLGNEFARGMSLIHISDDNKYMLMKSVTLLMNFDLSHIKLTEQKVAMIAASPVFVKNELFDRNLLPLIFEFLPKLDKSI